MTGRTHTGSFLAALPERPRARLKNAAGLREALKAALATAQAAHPDLKLPAHHFLEHVASHLQQDATLEDVAALNLPDLYLACACAMGLPLALLEFDRSLMPRIRSAVARQGASDAEADEVCSQLSERLLAPGESGPRISRYAGRGSLSQWVRAAAVRALIDHRRVERPQEKVGEELATALPDAATSPELSALKAQHREAFNRAFHEALGALSDRDRTLLRMHTVEHSTIDDIGALYRVHRVTAFRWVEAARQRLVDGTRDRLKAHWRTDTEQLESVLRGMASAVDISLRTALRRT